CARHYYGSSYAMDYW
nr:immunoglobulin heavy chain junction region [Mus musculus]MBK4186593.1 immunoglobulin heavy chain junction region [Mus musculus]MBK4186594.1 immunoglobulin heavy chain junction region [Mus musculus]MBK4195184.1 immunoglobulin heavy chain junction region [Mus musculus]